MSGTLEPDYLLVKDPDSIGGGWGERAFRVGDQVPLILPSVQIDLTCGRVMTRGSRPEDVTNLVNVMRALFERSRDNGGTGVKISCDIADPSHASDPTFLPRAYLDCRGHLRLRARTASEGTEALRALVTLVLAGELDQRSSWETGQIEPGAEHRLRVTSLPEDELRLAAKIGYGLAFLTARPEWLLSDPWSVVRTFVLAGGVESPVKAVARPSTQSRPGRSYCALLPIQDSLTAVVGIYGGRWIVSLGAVPSETSLIRQLPAGAISLSAGSSTDWLSDSGALSEIISDFEDDLR